MSVSTHRSGKSLGLFRHRARGAEAASAAHPGTVVDDHLLALAKLAPTRAMAHGEILVPAADADGTIYVVLEGALALYEPAPAGPGPTLAALAKGDAVRIPASASALGGAILARDASTLLVLSPDLVERLPVTLQSVVWRAVASTTTATAQALLARETALSATARELGRLVKIGSDRARRFVGTDTLRAAIASIPVLPAYAVDLAGKLLAPDARVNDIVESIKGDPALAALVLKTVNSSYFGLSKKVSDYYRAFLLLGANNVYRLVLDRGLRTLMPDTPAGRAIQTRSYVVSTIASELALRSRRLEPQLATTIGLLHDLGAAVAPVMAAQAPGLAPALGLLDTAKLGADLLAAWGLPEAVHRTIEMQQIPEYEPPVALPPADAPAVGLLYLARVLTDLAMADPAQHTSTAYLDEHLAALGFGEYTAATLLRDEIMPTLARQARHLPAHVQQRLPGLAD